MLEEPSTCRGQMACYLLTRPVGSRYEQGKGCEKGLLLPEGMRTAIHALACPEWGASGARGLGRGLSWSGVLPSGVALPGSVVRDCSAHPFTKLVLFLLTSKWFSHVLPHRNSPRRPDCGRSMTEVAELQCGRAVFVTVCPSLPLRRTKKSPQLEIKTLSGLCVRTHTHNTTHTRPGAHCSGVLRVWVQPQGFRPCSNVTSFVTSN